MADFLKLYFRVAFVGFLTRLASGSCNDLDLGMKSGSVNDSQITSSSVRSASSTPAKNGRLDYNAGSPWCAATSDASPYLQIDLHTLHIICAVSTQGNSKEDQWVKTYKLQSSNDGSTWADYKEGGQAKIFIGNVDRNSEVKLLLNEGLLTRYLRFLPTAQHGKVCIRTELFGVKKQPENLARGKTTDQSTTYSSGVAGRAVDGNADTEYSNGHCSHTLDTTNPSWWRVDLGEARVPVSEVYIVNRFSQYPHIAARSRDYKITLGASTTVTSNPPCVGLYSFLDFKASAVCFTSPLMTGRYLGIMTTRKQFLQLCEVEIYSRENIAANKPASQSSTPNQIYSPDGAVDGNTNTLIGSPCTHTQASSSPWWMVDLRRVEHVSELYIVNRGGCCGDRLTEFEIRVGTIGSNGGVSNPRCGEKYSVPQGKGLSFYCRPSLYGRYVTITIPGNNKILTLCEVEVYSERRACLIQAVGVASSDAVPDDRFSASSFRSGNEPLKGRLTGGSAWAPSSNNANDYLQIDLGYDLYICAVATQGNPSADQWTTKYKLRFYLNNSWKTYQENNNDKVFNGNSGRNDIVKHNLKGLVIAKATRLQPTAYSGYKALRVEVYGVEKPGAPSQAPASFALSPLTSTSVRASWKLPPLHSRHGIIKGYKLFYKRKGSAAGQIQLPINSWSTRTKDVTGLEKYTEYVFKVLAFTSVGDGPKSTEVTVRTKEDAPSQAPASFVVAPLNSTSVRASWQLPPLNSRHGIITGFKLSYKQTDSGAKENKLTINGGSILTKVVTALEMYTEYTLQVLAFTSAGDGPKSLGMSVRTNEGAPSVPISFGYSIVPPTRSLGPMINLTWSRPAQENGIIRGYTVFYRGNEYSQNVRSGNTEADTLTYTADDVLGGVTYSFFVRAVTIAPGTNASLTVKIPEYAPGVGPENISFSKVNETAWNVSWTPIPREKSHGTVKQYQVKRIFISKGERSRRSTGDTAEINSTQIHAVLYGLQLCAQYNVSVQAFTTVGPGPYGRPTPLRTSTPGAPRGLAPMNINENSVTLKWEKPVLNTDEGMTYTVEYSGSKDYNSSFADHGEKQAHKSTTCVVTGLVPGTRYNFQVYGTSVCGKGTAIILPDVATKITDPVSPAVQNITTETVDQTSAEVLLWPAEQRNGPIGAYQVIVLKSSDEDDGLPPDYRSKLEDYTRASEINLNFYITAELEDDPVRTVPWQFTVGDGKERESYENAELKRGKTYIVYQRAITYESEVVFAGKVSRVARITVNQLPGHNDETKSPGSSVAAAVAVPLVLLILILIVVAAVFFFKRRRRNVKRDGNNRVQLSLDNLGQDPIDTAPSRENLVYENVNDIGREEEDPLSSAEDNLVYCEPEDGLPRAIPVTDFPDYYKKKAANGGISLREEFKAFTGGLQFPWSIGQKNKVKNRYGNIVTYVSLRTTDDHSRVVLDKTMDDPTSDYINASYIPTFDEEPPSYIATQGPTKKTVNDFWRMIWQENCSIIVMLTNLIEIGKAKCEKYWPDRTTKYGAISVTLHKSESFADYKIRTFSAIKDKEEREVVQFHFTSWPDKGVPRHATPLLGFRRKIRSWSPSTDGPLVVHCSAGVGRTGTFIALDAMLKRAKKKKNVFIHQFMRDMRGARPHMVQTENQYVFLHQAVMEALTCGHTEISVEDLTIAMNNLEGGGKSAQNSGYKQEFQRLELFSTLLGSNEQTTAAFEPKNVSKNRFPNIVPLDTARVILTSPDEDMNYINASFVDEYRKRNAYIVAQAPLENTIDDFWQMVSQYNVGTIVMLNGLNERKESFPQYWPSHGSEKYKSTSVQLMSENQVHNITTRTFSVFSGEPRRKKTTVQHLYYSGWTSNASCPDPQEILDLLTAVQQSQQETGNELIVFHCSNGIGRSGTMAAIMSIVERAKTEQNIDVFQAIKLIRVKRPGAVDSLEQYMFCYETVQAYLDSFSDYANFTR